MVLRAPSPSHEPSGSNTSSVWGRLGMRACACLTLCQCCTTSRWNLGEFLDSVTILDKRTNHCPRQHDLNYFDYLWLFCFMKWIEVMPTRNLDLGVLGQPACSSRGGRCWTVRVPSIADIDGSKMWQDVASVNIEGNLGVHKPPVDCQ